MRKLLLVLLVSLFASAAQAATVTAVGDSFGVNFNGIVDTGNPLTSTVVAGLTASSQFTVQAWSYDASTNRTTVTFDIVITNTTDSSIWEGAVITAIGFDTDPNALSGTSTGVFSKFVTGGSFPTGAGFNVEYCASGSRNGCRGNATATPLGIGQSGTASVTMTFSGNIPNLDFSNFGVTWQRLDSARLGFSGDFGFGVGTPPIPEPAAMMAFGLGALIVGAALRKRAQ